MVDHTKHPFESAIAELDRLRAIEQAARALFPAYLDGARTDDGCQCSGCEMDRKKARAWALVFQGPSCLFTKLAQALALASGAGSEQGK